MVEHDKKVSGFLCEKYLEHEFHQVRPTKETRENFTESGSPTTPDRTRCPRLYKTIPILFTITLV